MILSWKPPPQYNPKLIGSYDVDSGAYETPGSSFDYLALLAGQPHPEAMDKPPVFFQCKTKKLLEHDCLWLLGAVPLVSARLADFLTQHAGADIQLIQPLSLIADAQEVSQPYYIVNAIKLVNAVDHARSEAERDDDGTLLYFNKTWFLQAAPQMGQIAREPESGDLLIRAALADSLIDAGFRGDKGLGLYSAERRFVPYRNNA
ncbi:imm11 family protein [Pseudomonas piscis]|uniref:Immunity MXAN-0049 protein domain-containing protein n=1 Tax=Pseudomonas piscis TaxID=2614538 RepID=A0A7X1PJ77_9PSED|nr:DUF1629 domain-containing protein [Pseudomonas piscis]MQA51843.1 hypothetical protein [Pseudomonas piscis]